MDVIATCVVDFYTLAERPTNQPTTPPADNNDLCSKANGAALDRTWAAAATAAASAKETGQSK